MVEPDDRGFEGNEDHACGRREPRMAGVGSADRCNTFCELCSGDDDTLRYARAIQCTPNYDINRLRALQTRSVLHLVLHGSRRPRLSADVAFLFEKSRSSPSSGQYKNDTLTY